MLLMNLVSLVLALASFQKAEPQTPGPLVWTGALSHSVTGSQNVMLPQEQDAAGYAAMLRASLADLTTRVEISRDFASQLPALEWLRAEACWQADYPGKAEIAADITVVRANWLEKLGRHDEAVYAAQHAYVMPEETGKEPYAKLVWLPSEGRLAELVNRTDALPAMVELHKRFPSGATSRKAEDPIDEVVRRECLAGSANNLYSFGARCVPGLLRLLREDPKRLGEVYSVEHSAQPLAILTAIDRASAGSLLLSTLGKRGPDWTMRAIFSFSNALVTKQVLVPSPDAHAPNTTSDALTLKVVDAIARENLPAPRFVQLLEPLVGNDIVSPAVRDFLLELVPATDPALLAPLRSMLDGVRVGPNKRALYEAFLESPDPDLRSRCARALADYDVGPVTLRATEHNDANVRQCAARALVRHVVWPYDYERNTLATDKTGRWLEVPRTPEIAAALMRLARDPEKSVRLALLQALQESSEDPAADLLELVLTDPVREVRQAAAYPWPARPELQARVLERLAGDGDAGVLQAVGNALTQSFPRRRAERVGSFQLLVPALVAWLANPALSFNEKDGRQAEGPLEAALADPSSAKAVFEACARGPHRKELLPVLAGVAQWARTDDKKPVVYGMLDAASIAELFAAAVAGDESRAQWTTRAVADFAQLGELELRPFLELARDEQRPLALRLRALRIAAVKDDPALMPFVLGLLRSVRSEEFARDTSSNLLPARLEEALRTWPGLKDARNVICTDAQIPDALALFVTGFDSKLPALDAAATRACLARWARVDEDWKSRNTGVLEYLDPHADAGVLELWRGSYRDPRFTWRITDAMARFPVDESVPLLAEIARGEWLTTQQGGDTVRGNAIAALTRRLDDLGADALLQAIATAPSEEIRKKCFDGLEQIRKYQDEKQNWQKRKNGQAARDAAVAELLPMLEDANPATRAAAARSLATLRASEHLPKLVRLLKDKDASVRDAAQKALDALNEPEAKKP